MDLIGDMAKQPHNKYARFTLTGLLICGLGVYSVPALASIMCWVNKQNIRECGQIVPQEYSQQRIEFLNDKGIVIRIRDAAKTKEQLAEDARLLAIKKEKERQVKEQKRKDRILLSTFTTEKDLILLRDGKINAIQGIIDITNGNTKTLKSSLATLTGRAADYERNADIPPKSLLNDMENVQRQIQDNEDFIKKKVIAQEALKKKFNADLKRFRKLKAVRPR